jgi:hypothetical protein
MQQAGEGSSERGQLLYPATSGPGIFTKVFLNKGIKQGQSPYFRARDLQEESLAVSYNFNER